MSEFLSIFWRCYNHILHAAQICYIQRTMVGGAILTSDACSIHTENNRQMLNSDIMDNVIVRALKKSRVYCYYWSNILCCNTCCKCNSMTFSNPDVKKPFRKFLCIGYQSSAFSHRCGYTNRILTIPSNFTGQMSKHILKKLDCRFCRLF